MLKLKDFGEFKLIDEIKRRTKTSSRVLVGIGDDAAVIKCDSGKEILFTTDMLIEERHFRLSEATAYEIGWKAMAVNLSDIAAMGGVPTYAVVAAGLPGNLTMRFVRNLYRGLHAAAKRFGVTLVGGDTNRSAMIVISVALLGVVEKKCAVKRSGAKIHDVIFVSGPLGGSYVSKKHLRFIPRIEEARYLVNNFKVNSMMDISDGLSKDIHRLCGASGVGAALLESAIPVSKSAKRFERALTDGEDFELLFTLGPSEAARLNWRIAQGKSKPPFWPIGEIIEKERGINLVKRNGCVQRLDEKGFDHFK